MGRNSYAIALFAAALFSVAPSPGRANVGSVTVGGDVVANCLNFTPASTSLTFADYSPFALADVTGSVSFTTRCTKEATPTTTFSVDGGTHYATAPIAGDRAMRSAASGYLLAYQLYADSSHTSVWPFSSTTGSGSAIGVTPLGNTADMTLALYGVIPHGQSGAGVASDYADTITVSVNY
jgi:spore coat protein U-like protein